MRRALRRDFSEYEVLTLRDMRPGDICEEFLSEALALKFLRELARDGYNMRVLRAILAEGLFRPDLSGLDDHETLRQLAWQLVSGKIRITTARLRTGVGGEKPPAEEEEPATPPPATEEPLHWIEFKVIDEETGEPISGVELKVKLTTGETKKYTTGGGGLISIRDIPAGTCDILEMNDDDALEVTEVV